jgi:hypothetical protein
MTRREIDLLNKHIFAQFGVAQTAYLKPVDGSEPLAFAIHAADGTCLGIVAGRAAAIAAIRQHDMEPAALQ